MADIPFPRGVRDLLPNEALFKNEVLKKLEVIFQQFGFISIDTPNFEKMALLKSKGGIGEDTKLIFELKNDDLGLRYDHTMSLARYISMHQEIPLPFKRYYIGKCWRREEPQKGRYWEFTQADVDIVGTRSPASDAEVIATAATFFDIMGIKYRVLLNNRKFMNAFFAKIGIKQELIMPVLRAIDKLEKIGRDGVLEQLRGLGIGNDAVAKVDELVSLGGSNTEKLQHVERYLDDKAPQSEMNELISLLSLYSIKGDVILDFSLARGFDYYTDMVVEFKIVGEGDVAKDSIGGGGRYDNLIGMMGNRPLPAVGCSIGIDRLLAIMGYTKSDRYTYAPVFVAWVKPSNYAYALKIANQLRESGIAIDINVSDRNISNQLSYANSMRFKYAAIIGDGEEKEGKLKLKNLVDGTENLLTPEDAVTIVQRNR